jgi:hypothetical protein
MQTGATAFMPAGAMNDLPGDITAFHLPSVLPNIERVPSDFGEQFR